MRLQWGKRLGLLCENGEEREKNDEKMSWTIVKFRVENQCQKSAEKGALYKHLRVKKLVEIC